MCEIHREKVSDKKHIEKSKISYNDSARIRKLNRQDKVIDKAQIQDITYRQLRS